MSERALLGGDGVPLLTVAHIKKEADGYGPSVMQLVSPSSPDSPDRQFCSSTTQSVGEPLGAVGDVKEEGSNRRSCLVCGDVASGFHYGVAWCEACKAFFKRTIQGNIEYTCPAANDCEINKRRRKACQACRFHKCLRMGMLKEGVRLDRVRGGRQKYRRSGDGGPYQIQSVPHMKAYASGQDNKLLEALAVNEPDISVTTPDVGCSDPVLHTLNILSDVYDQELVKIITWAKHIPGFLDLNLNDQMRLLQSTWAELLSLTVAFRSLPNTGQLKFALDLTVDDKMARECGFADVHQHMSSFATRIERLGVTKEEYYVLKALVLTNSDVRMEEIGPVKRLRETLLAALSDCVLGMRANSAAAATQTHSLLLCLPAVRQLDQLHRRFWSTIHRDGKVYMNKLFVEMLESYVR